MSFDALGAGYLSPSTATSNIPTWSHTITGTGLTVFVDTFTSGGTVSISASCGGTSMTLQASKTYYTTSPYTGTVYAFVLQNPPTGAQTITLTLTGVTAMDVVANSMSYTNVTGFGTAVTANGAGAPTVSATAASGQMVANAFGGFTTTFTSYSQTQRYNKPLGSASLAFVMGDATGTATFTATNGSDVWAGIAVPVL